MPKFTPLRFEQILAQMIAQVVTRTDLSDVSDISVFKHVLAAAARQDDEIYFQISNLLLLFSIDTAVGDDLDERAKDVQPSTITRIQASPATGTVVFSRTGTTGTLTIPVGTKVKTSDGKIFTTTTEGTITPASVEQVGGHGVGRDSAPVPIVADEAGSDGNVVSGTITKFEGSKPTGVSEVTNTVPTANGVDKESDDDFRQRIKDYIASLPRGTVGAIETALINKQDPDTDAIILFAKVVEDIVDRGNFTVYIDDGSGAAESSAQAYGTTIAADFTWNGTTTITTADTSEIAAGEFIGFRGDDQLFEIDSFVVDTSITILNPGGLTIPSGSGINTSFREPEKVTTGLAGPPADTAVGGETTLYLDNIPVDDSVAFRIVSSTRGILTQGSGNDVVINPATGQLDFDPALSTGEAIFAEYDYYTGLIAFAQKIVDGDPNDRENYPGYRAAGTFAKVQVPQVLTQIINVTLTVKEGFDQTDAIDDVREAIKDYINSLSISGDVIRSELIRRIMNVGSLVNVIVNTPTGDIAILDDQLARTSDGNITIT